MTPDETGLLISWFGRVDYVSFKTMQQSDPCTLNRHNHKKYYPMIAAAIKKDTLKIISVTNTGHGAECILSSNKFSTNPDNKSHNIFKKNVYRVIPLEGLVQGVALSANGDAAVIAYKKSLELINLAKKARYKSNFMPYDQGAFVVAISKPVSMEFSLKDQSIAAANSKGVIDLKTAGEDESKDYVFKQLKDVNTNVTIKEIHCSSQELLCVTSDNKIAIIDVNDLVEHAYGPIKYRTIEGCPSCKVSIGNNFSDKSLSTIHWRGDASKSEDVRFKVEVRREKGTSSELFLFSLLKHISKTYCRINDKGQSEEVAGHLLECRVGDNNAVVLTTDGELCIFQLPQQYKVPTEEYVRGLSPQSVRVGSFSASAPPSVEEKDKDKRNSGKKSGPRIIGSVVRSKESLKSPSATPRRSRTTADGAKDQQSKITQDEAGYIKSLIRDIEANISERDEG